MPTTPDKLTYESSGVIYEDLDPFKVLAQKLAMFTAENMREGSEVRKSRGESAYVWEEADACRAFVTEGLGTKSLVADEVRYFTGRTHYDALAQDTVAMIINDLITVGAAPQVVNAYFAVGDSAWFKDEQRVKDLLQGWADAVTVVGAVWGGGETPTLKGIIHPDVIDLSGSAVGIIKPKERLTLGEKLTAGDAIFAVESNGIHANGLTLARAIADRLPDRYQTRLADGTTYGESLLRPTHIYARFVQDLFNAGIDIHYMANVTGHGWRKLIRAEKEFTHRITSVPVADPLFQFIQHHSQSSDEDMYGTFNMGIGFVLYIPKKHVAQAQKIATDRYGWWSDQIGTVHEGPKQVEIQPKNILFEASSLKLRA